MIDEGEIYKYLGNHVKLIDTDGKIWYGYLSGMEGSNDSENGKYCVGLKEDGGYSRIIEFEEDEIKSIEISQA